MSKIFLILCVIVCNEHWFLLNICTMYVSQNNVVAMFVIVMDYFKNSKTEAKL